MAMNERYKAAEAEWDRLEKAMKEIKRKTMAMLFRKWHSVVSDKLDAVGRTDEVETKGSKVTRLLVHGIIKPTRSDLRAPAGSWDLLFCRRPPSIVYEPPSLYKGFPHRFAVCKNGAPLCLTKVTAADPTDEADGKKLKGETFAGT